MRILVISDNHGSKVELEEIMIRHKQDIDFWVHCGDSEFSGDHPLLEKFFKVKGNMDFSSSLPNELEREFDGVPVFIAHGHLLNIKMSLLNLYYRAAESGAKFVFFGHSHIAGHFQKEGIVFINPGSISLPRGRRDKSYAICDLDRSYSEVNIFYYNEQGEQLTDLQASYKL